MGPRASNTKAGHQNLEKLFSEVRIGLGAECRNSFLQGVKQIRLCEVPSRFYSVQADYVIPSPLLGSFPLLVQSLDLEAHEWVLRVLCAGPSGPT